MVAQAWSHCKWTVGSAGIVGMFLPGAALSAIWRYRKRTYDKPKPSFWMRLPIVVVLTPVSFFSVLSFGTRSCEERILALPEYAPRMCALAVLRDH